MRDNVSIIFAAIFAVVLLIVFPLFSLLTRQDNIAYNKVLTITTEFVDSIRIKGYFTEDEYTNYLVKLAATQNTYKVDMECHKKLLIKDSNKYTDANPVWVEDTAVYYNSYVENELKSSNVVALEEGDEFYIKVYNTNITTASLLYNFFLNSKIPRKVINIGYGGKILNSTGDTYTKTTFNSAYTPYITFGEVTNKDGDSFKQCYDQEAGTYQMQYCVRIIDINSTANNPIKVDFKLNNFSKIGDRDLSSSNFDENKSYFIDKIEENLVLRGDYIYSYDAKIQDLTYVADKVEGTIIIEDIVMTAGAWRTNAYIVILSNLGTGPTGAVSSEGTTEELTITRDNLSNLVVEGPYLSKNDEEVITSMLNNKETVYYKVTLRDAKEIKKLELYDTINSKVIETYNSVKSGDEFSNDEYSIKIEKESSLNNVDEYWISVTPNYEENKEEYFVSVKHELQIGVYVDTYVDLNVTSEVKTLSKVASWLQLGLELYCESFWNYDEHSDKDLIIYFKRSSETNLYDIIHAIGPRKFVESLIENELLYITRGNSDKKYKVKLVEKVDSSGYDSTVLCSSYPQVNCEFLYNEEITGGPEETEVYINFQNSNGTITSAKIGDYANIPSGFNAYKNNGNIVIRERYVNNYYLYDKQFYWVPAEESDIKDSNAYYDDIITRAMIRNSIRKYGGFWIATRDSTSILFDTGADFDLSCGHACTNLPRQWFVSMAYVWQLDNVYRYFGTNDPTSDTSWNTEVWVAEKIVDGKAKVAYWNGNGWSYKSYDKTAVWAEGGGAIKTLQVLYIE